MTRKNIERFKQQLVSLGISFDWSREINTTDPSYYKWTQWIFLQMFRRGLAYKKEMAVNWCTSCKCVLANEEVVNGAASVRQRSGAEGQIAVDAENHRLCPAPDRRSGAGGLPGPGQGPAKELDWPFHGGAGEIFHHGRRYGGIYTTRPDTIYGATYMVISPEHALVEKWADRLENLEEIRAYQEEAAKKSDFERTEVAKEKTGVELRACALSTRNGQGNPIFVSDYVLVSYGTGAIMAVPAHDSRDWEFAKNSACRLSR